MKITSFFISVFCFVFIAPISAQRSEFTKSNFLILTLQQSKERINDAHIGGGFFEGVFPKYVLRYERIQENGNRWLVDFNTSNFGIDLSTRNTTVEDGEDFPSKLIDGDLKISWVKPITNAGGFEIHLGPQFSSNAMIFNVDDLFSTTWMTAQNIEIKVRAFLPIVTRQNLELGFSYPVIGLSSRPDPLLVYYFRNNDNSIILDRIYQNSELSHAFNFINPEIHASYTYTFGNFGFYANLFYEYLSIVEEPNLKRSSIGGEFGIYFRL